MTAPTTRTSDFWWSGDRSEKYWIEQLRTDEYGDRLIAPDTSTYATMHGVEVGELRLPQGASVALVIRGGESRVPDRRTVLRLGEVSRGGRLAHWLRGTTD